MPRKLGRVNSSSAGFILPSIESDKTFNCCVNSSRIYATPKISHGIVIISWMAVERAKGCHDLPSVSLH
ncbi:hypothetical protein [Nostoc favosum]|uniref:hypothetical protein n=1 Tax=Nostoc favosum TaxID=2907819 RepID=UPI002795278C|nr:hypothetical protein [Nostoc favosum]